LKNDVNVSSKSNKQKTLYLSLKDGILIPEEVEAGGQLLMSGIPEPEGWHSGP
jgi:hypothetical protein